MHTYFKQLFQYDKWASKMLLDKFEKQFPQNERIYGLMSHLLSAQRNWLDRCLGIPQSAVLWGQRLPDEMRQDLENYNLAWIDFIESLHDADFAKPITYTTAAGITYTNTLTEIIAHVINHGTHHRGQILILMKEEGYVLPGIDLISYLR
ncbi:putative damage-inducible protein DinB [Mucilaginibacter gracilis]|uniref:Putative damage-inducible protein DinB n=1 Tax=Mucilaginibacter gracilis TaxID=423350 RepID=A0A495J2T5_9SPHI|nr:DinB family protein [Mucilaginibacter gracilis]RKR83247.1 putative damage-inducible protein DinB [Mucilaginibacter gracilis]